MKHPNNRFKKNNKNKSVYNNERFFCFFLISFGFSGLFLMFLPPEKQESTAFNDPVVITSPSEPPPVIQSDFSTSGQLHISGYLEANEELTFQIPEFHNEVSYFLDFGNGLTKKVKEPTIQTEYQHSGQYNVKLWGTYSQQKRLLYEKTIYIANAIEVAPDADYDIED